MTQRISYGPHLFPGDPESYIRVGGLGISVGEAHRHIQKTLVAAFSNGNPDSILSQISSRFGLKPDVPVELAFMNYGNTQLVYLATLGKVKVAVLINQPHTPLGEVKEEFNNLGELVGTDPRFVVEPYAYFAVGKHELYVSWYIDKALCIVHNPDSNIHGFYDPSPFYHFEKFIPGTSQTVNSSIIALLVNYHEHGKGLAKTQISGNDFILTRGFDQYKLDTILPNIRIIAARGFIDASLNEYMDVLRQEFLIDTNRNDPYVVSGKLKVNHKSKVAMTKKEIEEGIELGLRLKKERK